MLKKSITYEDYNGETHTDDFYFNLTKAELIELEVSDATDGFADSLKRIAASDNGHDIIEAFKRIILLAYGKKSEDGKRFIKHDDITEEFTQTEAYSNLFMELATNADEAVAFINAVVPKGMDVDPVQDVQLPAIENKSIPDGVMEAGFAPEAPSSEFDNMSADQMREMLRRNGN